VNLTKLGNENGESIAELNLLLVMSHFCMFFIKHIDITYYRIQLNKLNFRLSISSMGHSLNSFFETDGYIPVTPWSLRGSRSVRTSVVGCSQTCTDWGLFRNMITRSNIIKKTDKTHFKKYIYIDILLKSKSTSTQKGLILMNAKKLIILPSQFVYKNLTMYYRPICKNYLW